MTPASPERPDHAITMPDAQSIPTGRNSFRSNAIACVVVLRFFDLALDLLCIADLDGHFRWLNPAWEGFLGYSRLELTGRNFLDLIHPEDLAATRDAMQDLGTDKVVINFINRYRHHDGSYRWIEWRSTSCQGAIYTAARDVTLRVSLERQLRDSEGQQRRLLERLRLAVASMQLGTWDWDVATNQRARRAGRAAPELGGWIRSPSRPTRSSRTCAPADPSRPC